MGNLTFTECQDFLNTYQHRADVVMQSLGDFNSKIRPSEKRFKEILNSHIKWIQDYKSEVTQKKLQPTQPDFEKRVNIQYRKWQRLCNMSLYDIRYYQGQSKAFNKTSLIALRERIKHGYHGSLFQAYHHAQQQGCGKVSKQQLPPDRDRYSIAYMDSRYFLMTDLLVSHASRSIVKVVFPMRGEDNAIVIDFSQAYALKVVHNINYAPLLLDAEILQQLDNGRTSRLLR